MYGLSSGLPTSSNEWNNWGLSLHQPSNVWSTPLLIPHSIHSMLVDLRPVRILIRFLAWGGSRSPTPSAPKFVVANTIDDWLNVYEPSFLSNISLSMAFFTAGLALPYSSIIRMIGLFRCNPNSSFVTYRTNPSSLMVCNCGMVMSPKSLVVQSK